MSLMVCPYRRDPTTRKLLDLPGPAEQLSDLAGPERWRWSVWASSASRELGLTLLPALAREDLYAEGTDLDALEGELDQLERHASQVAAATHTEAAALAHRIANVRAAIHIAREQGGETGGVYIG